MRRVLVQIVLSMGLALTALAATAGQSYHLTITPDGFVPQALTIPAQERVKVMVENSMVMPAEIESTEFNMEKVIPGHTTLPVYIGPLGPGQYTFFNEFAQGVTGRLVVK